MTWETKTLDSLVIFLSGGTPSKEKSEYWNGQIPWVSAKDLKENRIYNSELYITEEGLEKGSRLVPENTILFVVRGMSLAKEFRIALSKIPTSFNQDLKALEPRENINVTFLFYSLYDKREYIRGLAGESSHGTKKLPTEVLREIKISVPPLKTQEAIADILSKYDDLIENNRRRIELLEESARLLYREWFVYLRFPGHEHTPIIDGIPQGWQKKKITDFCIVIDGTHDSPKPTEAGNYLVTGKHIVNGFIDFSQCYLISYEDHRQVMQRSKPEKGDILFSNIGTLGATVLVDQDFEFSIKNLALFKPLDARYSYFLYLHFSDDLTLQRMQAQASGTSQKFFSLKLLRGLNFVIPSDGLLDIFNESIEPILKQRSLFNIQNKKLQEARDLLLPRLMSGEIAV